jgi:DNA invertase Pin-like site-specific DNA recombinase
MKGLDMKVGYARISTDDQKLDLQKDALHNEGCNKIFNDTASGAKTQRKGLFDAIKFMRKGDTLVVWKLDRLGRSLKDLIDVVNRLNKSGVFFKSMQENIDSSTSGGKLTFHLFGALAEFERDIIRERTKAGLQAARARGRIGGRPKVMSEKMVSLAKELMSNTNNSAKDVSKTLGVSRATLYRYI